jgi:hypothetical protein
VYDESRFGAPRAPIERIPGVAFGIEAHDRHAGVIAADEEEQL